MKTLHDRVIEHWENNLERVKIGHLPKIGPFECAYCREFLGSECEGCPVMKKTGRTRCEGTPYQTIEYMLDEYCFDGSDEAEWKTLEAAVEEELEFLKSLNPGEENGHKNPESR